MTNRFHTKVFLIFTFFLCFQIGQSQSLSIINGAVIDRNGDPVIGATIVSKLSKKGVATDLYGSFSIEAFTDDTLAISSIGYKDLEYAVSGQRNIIATLQVKIELLDEVVVTGYGTQKKKDITGATTSIDENDFNSGVFNTPEQLIRGKMAGVELIQNDGEPGSGFTIRIRGASSIRADNNPLYVIDGFPVDINNPSLLTQERSTTKNALEFLNPEDIASIDVLKDASAAAIYGARGANGVVLITTKKGKIGLPNISHSSYVGVSRLRKKIGVFTAEDFRSAQSQLGLSNNDLGGNTDWQDEVYQNAWVQNHNLSFSRGIQNTSYRLSLGLHDQEGLIRTTQYTKYNGRFNLQQSAINERLKIDFNLTASHVRDKRAPGGIMIRTLSENPTWPIFDGDGNYFQPVPNPTFNHPIAFLELGSNISSTTRVLSNLTASFKILDELEYKLNVGADLSEANGKSYMFSQISTSNGEASISNRTLSSNLIEHYLTYTKSIDQLDITGLAGYSYQEFQNEGSIISRGDFAIDNIPLVNNINAGQELRRNTSYKEKNALQSFFGRVHLAYQNKYLLTANFRTDGSTRFGNNNKYGNFPSLALAWRLSDEQFMEGLAYLDDLKLRIGWGITGNQEIPNKISQPVFGTPSGAQSEIGETDLPIIGFAFVRTSNPNLQWEETRQINLGLDFSVGQGRWNGSLDYFDKSTTKYLLLTAVASAPTSQTWVNLDGEILNRGWELALNGHLLEGKAFKWESGLTFTKVSNNVTGLTTQLAAGIVSGAGQSGVVAQTIINNQPLGVFWGRTWLGFDENGDDIFEQDSEGNDLFGAIGYGLPDYTWGWSHGLTLGSFKLDFLIYGAHGHEILNNGFLSGISKQNFQFGSNSIDNIIYSEENINNNLVYSSRHIENGTFVRLSHMTLSYSLPVKKNSSLNNAQIYISGSNLLLWTDYQGYDPEVNIPRELTNNIPSIGIDYDSYPRPISFQIGLKTNIK